MNINRLLENSRRTSLIGRNIYTGEGFMGDALAWAAPSMGLQGQLSIGHNLPIKNAVSLLLFEEERPLTFAPVRHRWTPAWIETYYRSAPDEAYYPRNGCLAVREKKCFTTEDVFVSRLELRNDKRETAHIRIKLETPFQQDEVHLPVQADALGCSLTLDGFIALVCDQASGREMTIDIPAQSTACLAIAFAFSRVSRAEAEGAARAALSKDNPFADRERAFNRFMADNAPELICDDMDVLKAYYYRWFLVYRSLHRPGDVIGGHPVEGDCLYESPYGAWYGCPVGLPVPLHLEEAKWMRSGRIAFADAENWLKGLTCYQGFGYIQYTPMAIWHLLENHPDKALLERAYPECRKYALKDIHPDAEGLSLLPTLESSWPTGAEYQPAFYQHTKTPWDWTQDNEGRRMGIADEELRLYRLDHICYTAGNLIGCSKMAEALGRRDEADELIILANRIIELIRTKFWCAEKKCFVSLDARSGLPCDEALCYDSFFPFLWDMIGSEYADGWTPLFDKDAFACDFSLTTADRHCAMYWFDNCIAGPTKSSPAQPHVYGCCWNGPVWPYAVSGVAEALGSAARTNESLRAAWLTLFEGYTELHFMGGDRAAPMITEHYRPTDGYSFSKTCDYFHSTWIDLFMKYWAGIRLHNGEIAFEPYTSCAFELRGLSMGGNSFCVRQYEENGVLKRRITKL